MQLRFLTALAVTVMSMSAMSSALADDSKSYSEGTVTDVSSVRTKPGMFDAYMKWLDTTYKQLMEEEKKAGIIVDYAVYGAVPRSPHDPDLYLTVTFKNLAALDGLDERLEPIERKVWATRDAANKADADRESMREILGSQLIRHLKLK